MSALQQEAAKTVGCSVEDTTAAALSADYDGPFRVFFDANHWRLLKQFSACDLNLWEFGGELLANYKRWFGPFVTATAFIENIHKTIKQLLPQQRWNPDTATREVRLRMKVDQLLLPFGPEVILFRFPFECECQLMPF